MGNSGSDGNSEPVLFNGTMLRRSTLCVQVNGFPASIVEEEFNGTGAGVSYLFDQATQCADRL